MSPQVSAALIAGIVSLISLGGTVVVAVIGFRTTRNVAGSTLAEQRNRTLNERFATAAEQLGSDKPAAVRLAGVYAMAGLADDWQENRQTCVDVLCAYLRMPYKDDPGDQADQEEQLAYRANREVRHTIIRIVTTHLRDWEAVSWRGLNFDFTGVVFDGGNFIGAEFSGGRVSFNGAKFSDATVDFGFARFSGGGVYFFGARFSGGGVSFDHAEFSGSTVDFGHAEFSSAVSFNSATFSDGSVGFGAKFSGGSVDFSGARFSGGGIYFNGAEFSSGTVDFNGAEFSGSEVYFNDARFSGIEVDFNRAEFYGGTVDFSAAEFSGGVVDFSGASLWSVRLAFPWTGTPPPGVKLPRQEERSQA